MNPYPAHSDTELLAFLREGKQSAFETIYHKYARQIYAYIRKNIYNKEDCEEILQEIFESLWARRGELQIKSSLPAYLVGIARYKIIRYFRTGAVRKKYVEHFLLFEAVYDQAGEVEPDHSAIQTTLDKLINELPERCQQALRLRLSEDLSNRDIARRMNISTRTVEAYMFRAFNHIRESYSHYASHASLITFLLASLLRE